MNEKIKQVLEIERQAQEIQDKAKRDAQEIPVKAEQEGQALIAKARAEAEEEARKIIAAAQSTDDAQNLSAEAGEKNSQFDALARKNFDQAVAFVLERVIGRA
jgi:V/A-type H+/Na+-transporting ATPase subunit G/H